MKRQHLLLAGAGIELVRYSGFALVLVSVAGDTQAIFSLILGAAMSPGLLVAGLLFFLWKDAGRYAAFKPAVLLAKIAGLAGTVSALVVLLLRGGNAAADPARLLLFLGGALLLDAFVLAAAALSRVPAEDQSQEEQAPVSRHIASPQVETVVED